MYNHTLQLTIESLRIAELDHVEEEAILFFVTEAELTQGHITGHPDLDKALQLLHKKGIFRGAYGEVEALPTLATWPYTYVMVAGLGPAPTQQTLRAAAVFAARKSSALQIERLAVVLPSATDLPPATVGQALAEGFWMGTYRAATYTSKPTERAKLCSVVLLADATWHEPLKQSIHIARAYAEGTNYARDLTNFPGNKLTPSLLAEQAEILAKQHGFTVEVLDVHEMVQRGMGGLLAIGQGSANSPRMITLKYQGNPQSKEILGLIGKGVTFDTGGISLKPANGMEEMIADMGGAAAVLGAMHILGQLRPMCNCLAVIPTAENMPSATALKPGDVIHTLSGKTIEITNTDAEGRVILSDGMTYAIQQGATHLIDVATLTGAITVALGELATGAVTNDLSFYQSFLGSTEQTGENVWLLPSYPEYRKALRSDVADLKNSAKTRSAGAITGALFIGEFAESKPWIHLDIAGTAYLTSLIDIHPKGATGVMVRSLAHYALQCYSSFANSAK